MRGFSQQNLAIRVVRGFLGHLFTLGGLIEELKGRLHRALRHKKCERERGTFLDQMPLTSSRRRPG